MKVIVEPGHVVDDGKGIHRPGDEVDLSDKEANRLVKDGIVKLASSADKKTKLSDDEMAAGIKAALLCHEQGEVIGSGAPKVEAMEKILERDLTSAERDEIWKQALNVLPGD